MSATKSFCPADIDELTNDDFICRSSTLKKKNLVDIILYMKNKMNDVLQNDRNSLNVDDLANKIVSMIADGLSQKIQSLVEDMSLELKRVFDRMEKLDKEISNATATIDQHKAEIKALSESVKFTESKLEEVTKDLVSKAQKIDGRVDYVTKENEKYEMQIVNQQLHLEKIHRDAKSRNLIINGLTEEDVPWNLTDQRGVQSTIWSDVEKALYMFQRIATSAISKFRVRYRFIG